VGLLKRRQLRLQLGVPGLALQRRIKAAWDPKGLLNPGKKVLWRRVGEASAVLFSAHSFRAGHARRSDGRKWALARFFYGMR